MGCHFARGDQVGQRIDNGNLVSGLAKEDWDRENLETQLWPQTSGAVEKVGFYQESRYAYMYVHDARHTQKFKEL